MDYKDVDASLVRATVVKERLELWAVCRLGRFPGIVEDAVYRVAALLAPAAALEFLVVKLLSVVSEWERTRDALSAKRRRGQIYGRIAYGSRLSAEGMTLEADPKEARMLARLMALRATGATWKAIAEQLNQEGYRNRAGRPWILTNVRAAWVTAQKHALEGAP